MSATSPLGRCEHAQALIDWVKPKRGQGESVPCKFNLIPFNPFPASGLTRSDNAMVKAFAAQLTEAGIVTTIRKTRGDDIDAACGQLKTAATKMTRAELDRLAEDLGALPRVLSHRDVPGNPESGGTSFGPGYARLMDALGLQRFHLVGAKIGGIIASWEERSTPLSANTTAKAPASSASAARLIRPNSAGFLAVRCCLRC